MCIYYRLQICWESQNPIFKFLHSLSPSPTACMQNPWTFLTRRRTIVIIMVDTITLPSSRRVIVKLLWGSSVSPHPLWTQLAPKYLEFCLLDHWSESLEKSLKFSWKQHSSIQRMPKKMVETRQVEEDAKINAEEHEPENMSERIHTHLWKGRIIHQGPPRANSWIRWEWLGKHKQQQQEFG